MAEKKHPGLRTFEDVFNRMRWDEGYDMDAMTMGYDDRLIGAMEMPLQNFVPCAQGGDLPMHRVWYVRCGDRMLWDRRRKLDLVFGSGMTSAISAAGQGAVADQETTRRIEEALANVQRVEEERQHQLEVRLHAERHAEARRAGLRPCPGSLARERLILAAFRALDADGDGSLGLSEMYAFASHTGFEGSDEDWAEEYRALCAENGVDEDAGIGVAVFMKLVNDASDGGCHCADKELHDMALQLRHSSETAERQEVEAPLGAAGSGPG